MLCIWRFDWIICFLVGVLDERAGEMVHSSSMAISQDGETLIIYHTKYTGNLQFISMRIDLYTTIGLVRTYFVHHITGIEWHFWEQQQIPFLEKSSNFADIKRRAQHCCRKAELSTTLIGWVKVKLHLIKLHYIQSREISVMHCGIPLERASVHL